MFYHNGFHSFAWNYEIKISSLYERLHLHVLILKEFQSIFSYQELVSEPNLIVEGVSRFDYAQGSVLGKFECILVSYCRCQINYTMCCGPIFVLNPDNVSS